MRAGGREGLWVSAKEALSDRQTDSKAEKEAGGPSLAFGGNLGGYSFGWAAPPTLEEAEHLREVGRSEREEKIMK